MKAVPVRNAARFIKELVRRPGATGAIAPSSRFLAKRITSVIDLENAQTVVEYGPGTGSFTRQIKRQLPEDTHFFVVERSPGFSKSFRKRHPDIPLHEDCVTNIRDICDLENVDEIDCIVSGLPWASFSDQLQNDILDATMSVLKEDGQFVTFAYIHAMLMPGARRFRDKLRTYFSEVSTSRAVWLNMPPAFCYVCKR